MTYVAVDALLKARRLIEDYDDDPDRMPGDLVEDLRGLIEAALVHVEADAMSGAIDALEERRKGAGR